MLCCVRMRCFRHVFKTCSLGVVSMARRPVGVIWHRQLNGITLLSLSGSSDEVVRTGTCVVLVTSLKKLISVMNCPGA